MNMINWKECMCYEKMLKITHIRWRIITERIYNTSELQFISYEEFHAHCFSWCLEVAFQGNFSEDSLTLPSSCLNLLEWLQFSFFTCQATDQTSNVKVSDLSWSCPGSGGRYGKISSSECLQVTQNILVLLILYITIWPSPAFWFLLFLQYAKN